MVAGGRNATGRRPSDSSGAGSTPVDRPLLRGKGDVKAEGVRPASDRTMFDRILVAYDGSPNADHALMTGIELAKRFRGALELVTVAPQAAPMTGPMTVPPLSEGEAKMYREMLSRARQRAEKAGVQDVTTTFREGNVAEELLGHIEQVKPDVVIVGARGLSRVARWLMGSVSSTLVAHLKIPVLVDHLPGPVS